MAWLGSHIGVENVLVEPSPEAHPPKVLYIVRPWSETAGRCLSRPDAHRTKILPWSHRTLLQRPSQTSLTLNRCRVQRYLCYWQRWLQRGRQSVQPYRYGRGSINSPTPEETPPNKTVGCGRDARRYVMTWGNRRVKQPLVIPCLPCLEGEGRLALLHRYRKLNDITRKDCFPLSRIDDTGQAGWSQMVSTLGYWQVDLHANDKEKTAFSTGQEL
jgi:hypothetical protein